MKPPVYTKKLSVALPGNSDGHVNVPTRYPFNLWHFWVGQSSGKSEVIILGPHVGVDELLPEAILDLH
jgi:hypothetical protein